jgi:hypothetical protein
MNIAEAKRLHEWLEALKPGDEVAIMRFGYGGIREYELAAVQRLTATQVILPSYGPSERRFDRASGRKKGDAYGPRLVPVTLEVRDAIELNELVHWAGSLVTNHGRTRPPLPVLRALKKAYDFEMKLQDVLNPPA